MRYKPSFTAKVLNDIPLDGRDYVFAAQLTTGVAAPNQGFRQVAGAGDFACNGGLQLPNGIGYQNFNGTYTESSADTGNVSGSGLAKY